MHVWQHLQPPLQEMDNGQVGQSRTVSRGDTDPQSTSRVAATMQRRTLPRALAACLELDQEFLEFFRDPDNRAPDFEFEYRT